MPHLKARGKRHQARLKHLRPRRRWLFRLVLLGVLGIVMSWAGLQIAVRVVPFNDARLRNLDVSSVISDRNGLFLRAYLARDERWRLPAALDNVAPSMVHATIAAEDKRFYEHRGIDWLAVARAAWSNVTSGRIVSGASTISMQVAGFAINSRDRTLARKLRQAFLALQIERHWSKQQILECYLTHASYGGNICGVEAASRRYYNKTAADLSYGEAALLAGLPQSPERYRPDRHKNRALERQGYVLRQLVEMGEISDEDVQRIARLGVKIDLHDVPVRAPHFCDELSQMYPGEVHLRSTLDLNIQAQAEKLLKATVDRNRGAGVNNGAVVVLANRSFEVLALVGSADYWNKFTDGQVDAAMGFRSPGSALKPFIFGRAMDCGVLTPDETLFDVPMVYAGYSPQNYDRQFRGPVAAMKALAWSLNIPAINVLKSVGVPEFRDWMEGNGVPLKISPYGDPGLSLAIGTCSIRLMDLTRAYASLASGGRIKSAVWLRNDRGKNHGRAWISSEASDVILDVLADDKLRAPEEVDPGLAGLRGVAWKTGTSNGFHDAWTFAVTKDYTVGVWIGNMDGRASRALIGSKAAAPIALELARRLKGRRSDGWPDISDSIVVSDACAVTGLAPGPYCPSQRSTARFLRGRDADQPVCNVHKIVEVDKDSGKCLCTRCSGGHEINTVVCADFSDPIATWLRSNAHPWTEILKTPHNPNCITATQGVPPAIVSPKNGSEIILLADLPESDQKIALTARTADPSEELYWFINGTLAGVVQAYDTLTVPAKPGRNKVLCTDGQGRSSETWFTVEQSDRIEKAEKWSRLSDSN